MTFRKLRDLVGRLALAALLMAANLSLILKRAVDPATSWLDQVSGLSMDPVLIACALITMTIPPLWLAHRSPRLRARLSGYTGALLLANGLGLALLLLAPAPPAPTVAPSPQAAAAAPPPPVRPSGQTIIVPKNTATPFLAVPGSPTLALSPTPAPAVSPSPTALTPAPEHSVAFKPPVVENPYAAVDAHALAAPKRVENDIPRLARYLIKPAKNDREKIRAIHRWVSDRIAYDTVSFFAEDLPDQSAETTLRTKLSVCAGYANLVHALGTAAGLETVVVEGYARGSESTGEKLEREGHAWNAVKLDGQWRLLDSTWSAGSVGDDQAFHKEYDDFFFLTDARAFLNTHRPDEDKWQLVQSALTWEQFHQQPLLRPRFFSNAIALPPGIGRELKAAPTAVLAVSLPLELDLMAVLQDDAGQSRRGAVTVFREGKRATVSVKAPAAGSYKLRLCIAAQEASRFEEIAEFDVSASQGDDTGYPELSHALQKRGGRVLEPRTGVLPPGRQRFDIHVPGARKVFVDGWNRELQPAGGDRFTGELELRVGQAEVYAQFEDTSANLVASYRVRYRSAEEK